jgi:hypothetical protein
MATAGCELQNVTADKGLICQGLRQAGDVVDLDYPSFFIDRVKTRYRPARRRRRFGDP